VRQGRRESVWPLSLIDDINGVRVRGEKELDEAMREAASTAGIKWDRAKDWEGRRANTWE